MLRKLMTELTGSNDTPFLVDYLSNYCGACDIVSIMINIGGAQFTWNIQGSFSPLIVCITVLTGMIFDLTHHFRLN